MSIPPVAIDPAQILAFLSSGIEPQDPSFLRLFQSLHPNTSFSPPGTFNINEAPLRMYIVQQPAPAKHRRSYIEIKDLRALCSTDLKDSVLVMRRIVDDVVFSPRSSTQVSLTGAGQILTAGTLASFLSGHENVVVGGGGAGSCGGTVGSGTSMSEGGDDSMSSLDSEESMNGLDMARSLAEDHVASWMSNNTVEYLNMCMSMGHSDQSDSQSPPLPQGAIPPLLSDISSNSPFSQHGDNESDGYFYDDDDENDQDGDDSEDTTRDGKRSRATQKPRSFPEGETPHEQDPNQTLPQWFRPLVKNGQVQFEIWVVAFLKPQLLPVLEPKAMTLASFSASAGSQQQQQVQQNSDSQWTEAVNEILDSVVLQQFVRAEVEAGRIGIDFKRIMTGKKDRRRSTRRVIR
ncbi:hypothetical protein BGX29_005085 [Mortierella sp. GBA35]|nr:hypothetical protein BGX29_005085 [Mortierella sp. GBA35]